ncbi:MAG: acyl carrier protein [Sphingomonas sp.]|nr:acyl carrier protein [Sphingomonas sp.]MDX3884671.1 acyl carrier protein [Sphingomonas sp.]
MNSMQQAKELLSGCLFLPIEKIPDDANIQEIEKLDSLSFTTVIAEIEDKIGREMEPTEIVNLRTVRDIADLIGQYP